MIPSSVIILIVVFILIALRQTLKLKLEIWQLMLLGALAVLVTGQISIDSAIESINPDVMLFLFGMFVIGYSLEASGYLSHITYKFFKQAKNMHALLFTIIFVMGLGSTILMNDTLAIIGTPAILLLSRKHRISAKPMLLALCFAVTVGSVMSPIGNPQNLLIAINGNVTNPFVTFLEHLFVPTIINLFLVYLLIIIFFKKQIYRWSLVHSQEPIKDRYLAVLSKISLYIILIMILLKIAFAIFDVNVEISLTSIALLSCLPILLLSARRFEIIKRIDWHTLIFFASMLVLMECVWESGFFQEMIQGMNITSIPLILGVSIVLSQFISNVPLVSLYLPLLLHAGAGEKEMMALAAGSTIAGNLSILGAASNVIVIQNAEKKGEKITFFDFIKIGIPLTIANAVIYMLFLERI